jgi:PKD domain
VGHRLIHEQPDRRPGGPWFNNINATPVSAAPNSIYGIVGIQRLQHNLPAVTAFRQSSADAVTKSLQDLGAKYNFSIPLENPLVFKNTGSVPDTPGIQTVPAYMPADQAQYTPVLDDRTGRTDQVSFGVRGIPSLGDIGQYDSSTDPLVGGNDNPYPSYYPSKPTLAGEFGQDSTSDYFSNLNYWASGTVHGPGGYDKPSEGLLRGVEFIATWFSYVIASPQEGGAVPKPSRPIAYFEMTPKKPTAQTTVSFDAGFSRAKSGDTSGLTYYWDFGDGSPMVATTNPTIQHTFPTQAAWRDVKLLVGGGGQWNSPEKWGSFRQLEPIDFFPTYYPALVPPTEPQPPTSGGQADPCGALTASEQTALIAEAKDANPHKPRRRR